MTENATDPPGSDPGQQPPSGGGTQASGPHLAGPVRLLRRSTTDRKLAGVCGGLGAYTNIDPIIYRVLFAVFSLFGGFGLLLYGAAWLIIPEEGQDRSEIQRLSQGQGTSTAAAWALATTVLGFVFFIAIVNDQWNVVLWIIVIAAIAYFVIQSRRTATGESVGPWWSGQPPPASPAAAAPSAAATTPAAGTPTSPEDTVRPLPHSAGAGPRSGPRQKEPRSIIGWLALSGAFVAAGILVVLDVADVVAVPTVVILATALVILGLGLVVATWYGRARGLIVPGLALILALGTITTLGSNARGQVGELTVEPTSVAEIENPYRILAGKLTIDLRGLDLRGASAFIAASTGLGQIEVIYPNDIRIEADTDVKVGEIDIALADDARQVGDRVAIEPSGASRGTVRLELDVGVGNIELREGTRATS